MQSSAFDEPDQFNTQTQKTIKIDMLTILEGVDLQLTRTKN